MAKEGERWENKLKFKIDDVFGSSKDAKKEEIKEPEKSEKASDEDIELTRLGIIPEIMQEFRKKYNRNVFYTGKLTKGAFEWYLLNAKKTDLKSIEREKIPSEFKVLLEKALGEENADLLKQIEDEKTYGEKMREALIWLYEFMSDETKCGLSNTITEDDIKKVTTIKEMID